MTNPISSGSPDPSKFLPSIKITPQDTKLLDTPFGKWFAKAAPNEDQTTLIKEIKQAVQQYCKDIVTAMKHDEARMKEAAAKLKKAAEGKDPDS